MRRLNIGTFQGVDVMMNRNALLLADTLIADLLLNPAAGKNLPAPTPGGTDLASLVSSLVQTNNNIFQLEGLDPSTTPNFAPNTVKLTGELAAMTGMVQGLAALEQRAGVRAAAALEQRAGVRAANAVHVAAAKGGKEANPPPAVGGPLAVLTVVLGLATSAPVNEQQAYLSPKDGGTTADFQQVTTSVQDSPLLQAARDASSVLSQGAGSPLGRSLQQAGGSAAQALESSYQAGGTSDQIEAHRDGILQFVSNPSKVPVVTPLSPNTTPPSTAKLPFATNLPTTLPPDVADLFTTQPDKQLQFQAPNGDTGGLQILGLPGVDLTPPTIQGPVYDQSGNLQGEASVVYPGGSGPTPPTINYTFNNASVFNQGVPLYLYPSGESPQQGAAPAASLDFSDSIQWAPGPIQGVLNGTPQTSQQAPTFTLRLERYAADGSVIWEADLNTFTSVEQAQERWQAILDSGNPNQYLQYEIVQDQ